MTTKPRLGVGLVGYSFMGKAHSLAWREAPRMYADLPVVPAMTALVGRHEPAARSAADTLGWDSVETDYLALLKRPDIDLVDICTPGDSHADIAIAALEAGKHVLCEKPLANTVAQAEAMAQAATEAEAHDVRAMVGFNYRRVPAARLARDMVATGRLGSVRHVRAVYLQDWLVDPAFPLAWRLRADSAGSGALGDIGAHIIDLSQFMVGEPIAGVSAITETFVNQRPLPATESASASGSDSESGMGQVTVDDAAVFLARYGSGALATYEATRYATGRRNQLRIEINGSAGSLVFDMEHMNELQFYDRADEADDASGFRRIVVTEPTHPYLDAWWPPGHLLGWDHTFIHQARDLLHGIGHGHAIRPSFADGLQVQRVLEAVQTSAEQSSAWQPVAAHADEGGP